MPEAHLVRVPEPDDRLFMQRRGSAASSTPPVAHDRQLRVLSLSLDMIQKPPVLNGAAVTTPDRPRDEREMWSGH